MRLHDRFVLVKQPELVEDSLSKRLLAFQMVNFLTSLPVIPVGLLLQGRKLVH